MGTRVFGGASSADTSAATGAAGICQRRRPPMWNRGSVASETPGETSTEAGPIIWQAFTAKQVQTAVAQRLSTARSDDELIRRAAFGLAQVCLRELRRQPGRVPGASVVVLAGRGNNGADAVLAGAHLAARGAKVTVVATSGDLNTIATRHYRGGVLDATGSDGFSLAVDALAGADLVLDGIVGDAAVGALQPPVADLVASIAPSCTVVAVDLPSGVDPDTGEIPGVHVVADVTVSLAAPKQCLLLPPTALVAGRIEQVDVGLGEYLPETTPMGRLTAVGIASRWPVPTRRTHKFSRGMLGIVAGSDMFPGAAVLTVLGAYATGTGVVRYTGPRDVGDLVLKQVPEAERRSEPITVGDERLTRVTAWVLGPGVARDEAQDANVLSALTTGLPAVVDAGALDSCITLRVAGDRATPGSHLLITPHAGEAARLLSLLGHPTTAAVVDARPLWAAQTIATKADVTVLLKGSVTIVVAPAGQVLSQDDATPWLATGGAGDVLAGIAGALMGAGLDALSAGAIAAHIHGRAASLAAVHGPIRASDVARWLPETIHQILRHRVPGASRSDPRA